MNGKEEPFLLDVQHLVKYFPVRGGLLQRVIAQVKAVDDVSFFVRRGETLGLVGESGCGKTTVGRTILRLIPLPAARCMFEGQSIFKASARQPEADAARHPDHLPGPLLLARPARADRHQRGRGLARSRA